MVGSNTFVDTEIYAGNAQCAVVPSGIDRCNGVCIGYSLPAKWWNGMWCDTTTKLHSAYSMISSIYDELSGVIIESGQVVGASTTQLRNILYGRSVILGEGSSSECTDAVVIGSAAGAYCDIEGVVIGNSAEAYGYGAVAVGSTSTANGICSVAVGNSTKAEAYATSVGADSNSKSYSLAIGVENWAGSLHNSSILCCGIAIGHKNSVCSGLALGYCNNLVDVANSYSNVIGMCNTCVMHCSIVIGNGNRCAITDSIVIGNDNICVLNSKVIGERNNVYTCFNSTIIGDYNYVNSLAETNYPVRDAIVIGSNICVQHNLEVVIQPIAGINAKFKGKSGFVSYTYAAGSYTQREVFNELKQYIKCSTCNSLIGHYNGNIINYMQMMGCNTIQLGCTSTYSEEICECIQCNSDRTINSDWSILFVPNNV